MFLNYPAGSPAFSVFTETLLNLSRLFHCSVIKVLCAVLRDNFYILSQLFAAVKHFFYFFKSFFVCSNNFWFLVSIAVSATKVILPCLSYIVNKILQKNKRKYSLKYFVNCLTILLFFFLDNRRMIWCNIHMNSYSNIYLYPYR